jgi:hypothetical protein
MRKVSLAILAAAVALIILTNWSAVSASTGRVADRLLLYVRVVRLYTEEPDRKLAMPLHDVKKNQIADTWHAPRGTDRLHEGQDIFAPKGTAIYSATNGYVYNVGENALGGHTVSVIGAGGRVYYYAHLDSYAEGVAVGDYITTKTVLGYVGSTGNAAGTPPHLHFGVYASTGAINPLPLLADQAELPNGRKNVNTSPHKPRAKTRRSGYAWKNCLE